MKIKNAQMWVLWMVLVFFLYLATSAPAPEPTEPPGGWLAADQIDYDEGFSMSLAANRLVAEKIVKEIGL